jgi:hypothetical protein
MAINNKYKAYDSIEQIKLNNTLLAHMPMSRLNELLINYNNLDTQIGDKSTIRTRETLKNIKWAPITCNTYIGKVTKRNFEYDLTHVDNDSMNSNREVTQEHVQEINQSIEQASLRWAEQCKNLLLKNHVLFADTRKIQDTKNRITPTTKDSKNANSTEKTNKKLSDHNSKADKEGNIQIDKKEVSKEIKHSISYLPAYKIINYIKQRTLPEDKHIDKISPHSLKDSILQKINTRLALFNEHVYISLNRLNHWSKCYLWYISKTKNKSNCPLKYNRMYYDKWMHLDYLMKRYKIRTLKCICNGRTDVNQIDCGMIIWKNEAKIPDSQYMVFMKIYNATRSLFLINFRSLEKLYKRTKFNFKKIFKPPPNHL